MVFDAAAIAARWAELKAARSAGTPDSPESDAVMSADYVRCRALCISFMTAARGMGRGPESHLVIQKHETTWRERRWLGQKAVNSTRTFKCPCWLFSGSGYALLDIGELVKLSSIDTPSRYATAREARLAVPSGPELTTLEDKMLSRLAASKPAPSEYWISNDCDAILSLYGH